MAREPIALAAAAERLDRPYATLRVWAHRYHAYKLGKVGSIVYYDWPDLATIDRQLRLGEPVPPTPEERDEIRAAFAA
ncbi:hypothetical protein [Streptosporangium sandarakinum]